MNMDDQMSPVDLPPPEAWEEEATRPALAWTTVAMAVAALFLLVTNAGTLKGWAVELEPGPISVRVVALAERWEALVEPAGRPRVWLHERWEGLQALRFGGEKVAAEE